MTWAGSPGYGVTVALGPTQAAVLEYVMRATAGGRRPYVTLATVAQRVGRPVSSVHDALGRLRALGLIGCAARMGRTGGHRLWRVTTRAARVLDRARHGRAIARILRRWPRPVPAASATTQEGPPSASEPHGGGSSADRRTLEGDPPAPPRAGRSFREALRDYGFRPWWEDRPAVQVDDDRG